jgi:hypothetical protein
MQYFHSSTGPNARGTHTCETLWVRDCGSLLGQRVSKARIVW